MLGTWMYLEGLDLFLLQGLGTQMPSLSSHHWAVGLLPALVGVKTSAREPIGSDGDHSATASNLQSSKIV